MATPAQLQLARFLLGVAEAGFLPGAILYLGFWFPPALRARTLSLMLIAGALGAIFSGPLAVLLMSAGDGWLGLRGWQTLFVVEGALTMLLGVAAWCRLSDSPRTATWLSPAQQTQLADAASAPPPRSFVRELLRDRRCYVLGLTHFCLFAAINTVVYWTPSLIADMGTHSLAQIGLLASLPFALGMVLMYWLGRRSDRHKERRWHTACAMLVSALCFGLLGLEHGGVAVRIILLTGGAACCMAAMPVFWSIPGATFGEGRSAGGIALVGAMGSVAALVSPLMVAAIRSNYGSLYPAFTAIGLLLLLGAMTLATGLSARS